MMTRDDDRLTIANNGHAVAGFYSFGYGYRSWYWFTSTERQKG